ncbi:MAG: T9SS type A sorting domain-containing protein [Bacteroidota bacterium]|nr:T9SS type A sorting domain-containing protein [Bacteroidota bacterium]
MKKIIALLLFVVPASLFSQYTYNYLQIQHPQQTWRYGQGTIDQAVVSIRPKGNYVLYDMYLTISANGLGFYSSDSVEAQMEFALPKGAIVSDLWLWIDDNTIMKGLILDRWTASNIYENIVKRRRDPALLMKNSDLQYSLRIYPMVGTSYRKVKISYFVPANFNNSNVSAAIPTNIFQLSKNPLQKSTIFYWPSDGFSNPGFREFSNGFEKAARFDTVSGKNYFYGEIPASAMNSSVTLTTNSTVNKVFVGSYENILKTGAGYFQVSFNPATLFNIGTAQKVVFLFEFDESRSSYSTLSLINSLKSFLLSNFSSKDSFNLIFSGTQIKRIKLSGWIGGDSTSINTQFDLITQNLLQNSSNMQALITDGIDFIRNNGNTGALWLLAGSDKYNSYTTVNPAIQSISELVKPTIPIHITDISNWNVGYSYFNNKYYYGNDYFYENLSRITGSVFTSYRQNASLQTNFQAVLDQIRGTIKSFDMITRIENGFCSNRFTTTSTTASDVAVDKTITQIGKYNGQFPFILEVAGIYQNQPLITKVTIHDSSITKLDNSLETIWAGNYIAALEAQPQSNSNTKSIIDASLTYRVLSKYSAFLALEPSDTLKACLTCRDETKLVFVDESNNPTIPTNDSLLAAYPNPFNPETKLKMRLLEGATGDNSSLRIFNMLGQVVKSLDISSAIAGKFTEVTWRGISDDGKKVSSGVYFAVLSTPTKRQTIKLILTK